MDEINKIYEEVKDLESYLHEYNTAKTKLKNCDEEIKQLELKMKLIDKKVIENKIATLESEYNNILNEMKKIDLCSKECFKITEIKTMFEFINDKDLLMKKCINFLNSLIYDVYVSKENLIRFFNPQNYCNFDLSSQNYKIIKISNDLNELFNILKIEEKLEIFTKCYSTCKFILEEMLESILPNGLLIYYDLNNFYLIFASDQIFEIQEEQYFSDVSFTSTEFLYGKKNITNIFYDIFKRNLVYRLLENTVDDECIINTNNFFKDTEYFITNIDEWALDCIMKEVICISKSQKTNNIVDISNKKIAAYVEKVDSKFLPLFISQELYRFLLCVNIYNKIESKRITKATKIIERGLYKLLTHGDTFVTFADVSLCLRVFSHLSILQQLSNLRESLYCEITKKSTEISKNLQDSLILLKVYFKGKHFEFLESVKKFVPINSQLSFEITFFNVLYSNVLEAVLCIKYLPNYKIADIGELLKYLLELSFNIPKESISVYLRFYNVSLLFQYDLDETMTEYKAGNLQISKNDLKTLIILLHKESKTRDLFIRNL